MLINNLSTERKSSLIVKNSEFYIELAKFVQAYTTIVKNPNEFLPEVNLEPIDMKKQHLTWDQLVEIMQKCDLGFAVSPTRTDLVVYYNYALEMGSVDVLDKKLATVEEVAEAQKHYYNFVDEAKDKAEEAYQKQRKVYEARQREVDYIDGNLAKIKAKNWFSALMMFFSMLIGIFGVVGFFIDNLITRNVGKIIPVWNPNYTGGIVLIIISFLLFFLFNKMFISSKKKYVKLRNASEIIFARVDETFTSQQILKRKLDEINKDYAVVQREINDKNKKFDVKHNIDELKVTNKYYKVLCEVEEELDVAREAVVTDGGEEEFAPIKLTKEQEENMRVIKNEAISLEGKIDTEAYNEKFEVSEKEAKRKKEEAEKTEEEKAAEEDKKFIDSVDYIKNVLGMAEENAKISDEKSKDQEQ